jgi:hypothetical protein
MCATSAAESGEIVGFDGIAVLNGELESYGRQQLEAVLLDANEATELPQAGAASAGDAAAAKAMKPAAAGMARERKRRRWRGFELFIVLSCGSRTEWIAAVATSAVSARSEAVESLGHPKLV